VFWKIAVVERGFLMVKTWWNGGETWWGDCRFVAAKNMPLFSTLFWGFPKWDAG
jgi:hypothetical protein